MADMTSKEGIRMARTTMTRTVKRRMRARRRYTRLGYSDVGVWRWEYGEVWLRVSRVETTGEQL